MKLNTPEALYRAVLDGIKKESTAVLTPDRFNRLINNFAIIDWMNEKAPKNDYDQAVIDDLRRLYKHREVNKTEGSFLIPEDYHRLQSVQFRVDSKEWEPAKRLRFDSLSIMKKNPYRTPTDDRLYYFQEGDTIRTWPYPSNYNQSRVFYLARPKEIIFNPNSNIEDPLSPKESNEITDLGIEQCRQIVDIAIRIEIERIKEERYQTQLIEENLRLSKQ